MKLLVDTCTFLWIVGGGRELPPRIRDLYLSADNEVYLSAVSAWEIAVKHANGRMPLPEPPERLVPTERDRRGMTSLPFDEESALHVSRLPVLHRDPFDRMLVSQAIVHGLVILTPDHLVSQYPARTMW
jgi:PIN domain nuclease of toxin-antitoxin system